MNAKIPLEPSQRAGLLAAQRAALARFRADEEDLAEMIADAVLDRFFSEAAEMIGDDFCYSDTGEIVATTLGVALVDAFDAAFERIALTRLKTLAEQAAAVLGVDCVDASFSLAVLRRGFKFLPQVQEQIDEALRAALPTAGTMLGAIFSEIFEDLDRQIDRLERNRRAAAERAQRAIHALEPHLRQQLRQEALKLLHQARLDYAATLEKAEHPQDAVAEGVGE